MAFRKRSKHLQMKKNRRRIKEWLFLFYIVLNLGVHGQTNQLRDTGYAGVNTTTPYAPLHVVGGQSMTGGWNKTTVLDASFPVLLFKSDGTNWGGGIKWGGIGYDFSSAMRFWTNASSSDLSGTGILALSILNNGKVGIGPPEPIDRLHIYTGPTPAYGTSGGITISDSYTAAKLWDSQSGSDNGTLDLFHNGISKVRLISSGNSYINGGNVGIGPEGPTDRLHIYAGPNAAYGTSGGITISDTYTVARLWDSGGGEDNGTVSLFHNGLQQVKLISSGNSYINGGNVGIGTENPTEKLTVNGNIRSRKLIISQSGWPDYVFDSAYQLTPLAELATYIKANKHLPGIPSVKEVETNGVSVGDTQALLLQKIEELTLYLIRMSEENVVQKRAVGVLHQKLLKQEQEINDLKQKK